MKNKHISITVTYVMSLEVNDNEGALVTLHSHCIWSPDYQQRSLAAGVQRQETVHIQCVCID